ncbi:MAG: 4Fe-4S binding protein [Desulfamplus sp.]|nr:4Fe-4S binding protein [Desulfamplus sp.]
MTVKRKIIQIDEELCDGCGNCVPSCAEGAIQIIDGKAKIVKDQYCDGLGACLGECPQNALHIIEREADEFDEKAVEAYLKMIKNKDAASEKNMACGCSSSHIQIFSKADGHKSNNCHTGSTGHSASSPSDSVSASSNSASSNSASSNSASSNSASSNSASSNSAPSNSKSSNSALGHWPVQIRLIPATAPFLKGAHLLVTADCVPVAYPCFHQDFLKGKVVMIGCPKFDDIDSYVEKFASIFKTADIKSVTTLIMEVPCCSGLPMILQKAMVLSGVTVPITNVVISARGEVLN